jgi:hypothetical protein
MLVQARNLLCKAPISYFRQNEVFEAPLFCCCCHSVIENIINCPMGTPTSDMDLFILLICQELVLKVFFTTIEISHTKEKSGNGTKYHF